MRYDLPPRLQLIKFQISDGHNRRLMVLMGSLVIGYFILLKIPQTLLLVAFSILEAAGLIYVMWRNRRQCIDLGFVCPVCGGTLYENSKFSNRLGEDGQCPRCGEYIIDQLK
jgi:hypothetical protein